MMLTVDVPGRGVWRLEHLVLDFNGTMAVDGTCAAEVKAALRALAGTLKQYILTADTYGTVARECADVPAEVVVVNPLDGGADKLAFVEKLGPERTAAVGNGFNDAKMLARAALGVLVLGPEGAAGPALAAADIVVPSPVAALSLFLNPKRLIATLRK